MCRLPLADDEVLFEQLPSCAWYAPIRPDVELPLAGHQERLGSQPEDFYVAIAIADRSLSFGLPLSRSLHCNWGLYVDGLICTANRDAVIKAADEIGALADKLPRKANPNPEVE